MTAPLPGWYLDPQGMPVNRYWDGAAWSAQTQPWQADYRYAPWRRPSGVGRLLAWVIIVPILLFAALVLVALVVSVR